MDTKVTQRNPGIGSQTSLVDAARAKQLQANREDGRETRGATKGSTTGDFGVNLSSTSKDLAVAHKKAMDIALDTPEIREDKVAALKKQIAEGTYKVDSGKIADGMIKETLFDYLHATGQDWEA